MLKFACPPQELSCIIGHIFIELEPPCAACEGKELLTLCGTTHAGQKAVLIVDKDGFYFDGNPEDINKIRESRCMNGAGRT